MRLSRLKKTEADLVMDFGDGDVLNLVYNPSAYDGTLEDGNTKRLGNAEAHGMMRNIIIKTVKKWDFSFDTDDTDIPEALRGNVIGLNHDELKFIPLPVLQRIYRGIQEDMRPNETKSEDSGSF